MHLKTCMSVADIRKEQIVVIEQIVSGAYNVCHLQAYKVSLAIDTTSLSEKLWTERKSNDWRICSAAPKENNGCQAYRIW